MPAHIKGVMNLRGTVLPVVGPPHQISHAGETVHQVHCDYHRQIRREEYRAGCRFCLRRLSIAPENINTPPDFGLSVDRSFILGLLKASDRLSILFDLDRLLTESEVTVPSPVDQSVN